MYIILENGKLWNTGNLGGGIMRIREVVVEKDSKFLRLWVKSVLIVQGVELPAKVRVKTPTKTKVLMIK